MPRLYCNELWEVQSVTSAPQADYVEVCRKSASGPTEVDELWVWTVVSTHRLPGNVPEKSAICKSGEVLMSLHLLSSVCAVSVDQSVWCTVDFAAQRIVGQIRLKSMWPVRRTSGHFLIFCVLRHTKSFSGILNSMVELQQSLFHTPDMQNITLSRVISTCAMNSSRTYQQNNIFEWEKQMICVLEMGLQQVYSFFHSHLSLLSGKWCTVDGQVAQLLLKCVHLIHKKLYILSFSDNSEGYLELRLCLPGIRLNSIYALCAKSLSCRSEQIKMWTMLCPGLPKTWWIQNYTLIQHVWLLKHTSRRLGTTLNVFIGKMYSCVTCSFLVTIYVAVLAVKMLTNQPEPA